MDRIVIYGNGTVATDAYYDLLDDSPYNVAAFTVDRDIINESTLHGLPIVPFDEVEHHFSPDKFKMIIAVGYNNMNKLRAERYDQAKAKGYCFISHIHSKAVISSNVPIGDNCMIGANTVIRPGVKIGNDVIIRENCILSHNDIIADHCFIGGGVAISGNVTIEKYCFLGTNSTFRDNITIAKECLIGAGVTMLNDTSEKEVYMNKPAQKLPVSSDKLHKAFNSFS